MSAARLALPPRWSEEDLEQARTAAIARFVEERRGEGVAEYQAQVVRCLGIVSEFFAETDNLREFTGATLGSRPEFVEPSRFLCAPPVSADDLNSLTGHSVAKRKVLTSESAEAAASVLQALFDPVRLTWLAESRRPTPEERRAAIGWTAGVWAAELQRTSRRTRASRRQEDLIVDTLRDAGFDEVRGRPAVDIIDALPRGSFSREARLDGAKCDVPVRLLDGRLLAIEAKVSNSAINSVKRLIRETGGKARSWRNAFGQQVLPATVLSGVYKLANLLEAQDDIGLAIFWEHDLAPLRDFVMTAR